MNSRHSNTEGAPRVRFGALDPIFHERARLSIMTTLAGSPEGVSFTDLRKLCSLTDGNLSRHLQKLAEANLVEIEKRFLKGIPNTTVRVTASGIQEFRRYVEELAEVVEAADRAVNVRRTTHGRDPVEGLDGSR